MNLRNIFSKKTERILFFEADREEARALKTEINMVEKTVQLGGFFNFKKEGVLEQSDILSFLGSAISEKPKSDHLVLVLGKPFLKSKSFGFSMEREDSSIIVEEEELENFSSLAVEKAIEEELPKINIFLGKESVLAQARVKYMKLDGRKIMSPIGFSGQKLGIFLENIYSENELFEGLEDLLKSKRIKIRSILDRTLNMDKAFSYLKEEGVLIDITNHRVRVGLLGSSSQRAGGFRWGWDTIRKEIMENLSLSSAQAEEIRMGYIHGEMSKKAITYFDNLFKEEMRILAEGLLMTLKSFNEKNIPPAIYFSGADPMLPIMVRYLEKFSWGRGLFLKRPEILIYPKREIFDKMELEVGGEDVRVGDLSLSIILAVANQFVPEPNYSAIDKLIKRFVRWFG